MTSIFSVEYGNNEVILTISNGTVTPDVNGLVGNIPLEYAPLQPLVILTYNKYYDVRPLLINIDGSIQVLNNIQMDYITVYTQNFEWHKIINNVVFLE